MLVLPTGPTNSPLLALVGEAPGAEEERSGQPFVGASGHLLTQMLSACGISRSECYITNVSQVRPPGNDFQRMYYDGPKFNNPTSALLDCRERLWKEMALVRPKVIVALGAEALKALGGKESIKTYRGTMLDINGVRILPTFHPAFVLRMYENRAIVETDLKKAYRQALSPSWPQTYMQHSPSYAECLTFLRQRPKRLTLDIETLNLKTRCIGFGLSKHEAISIPLITKGTHHWDAAQEYEILKAMDGLLRSPDVEFVLQNSPFDLTVLAQDLGLHVNNVVLDTMFAHHLLFPELPKGLDFLSSIYTDHPMYWDYDSKDDVSTRTYNCMDCIVTFEAGDQIEEDLKDRGMWEFYKTIINPVVFAFTRMQSRGVSIDTLARDEIGEETRTKMDLLKTNLRQVLGDDKFNPSSPPQVSKLVYETWGLPRQFSPQKKVTTDDDALRALIRKTHVPMIKNVLNDIISYRKSRVLLSTFVEMPLKNNRVHTSYNPGGTVTGRASSSATIEGIGGNLQNIPRGKFRRIFQADPGKILIKADLSQAEYRVLIWKANIRRIIDRLLNDPNFSIHRWNAAENIYQVPYEQVTKKMYDEAKNGVYGANYGVGALKISRMYDIELPNAKFIISRYHAAVPEIREVFQADIIRQLETTRTLTNPFGRQRVFLGRQDDELYRSGFSHYCQSTVADLISSGLITLDDWEVEVLLQIHDELVIQAPEEHALDFATLLKTAMERPITFPGTPEPLIIPTEVKIGRNWYDTKTLKEYELEKGTV